MLKVAYLKEYLINTNGMILDKNGPNTPLHSLLTGNYELRVIPDRSNINSLGFPTIDEYLNRESDSGNRLLQIGVNSITTKLVENQGFDYELNFTL